MEAAVSTAVDTAVDAASAYVQQLTCSESAGSNGSCSGRQIQQGGADMSASREISRQQEEQQQQVNAAAAVKQQAATVVAAADKFSREVQMSRQKK